MIRVLLAALSLSQAFSQTSQPEALQLLRKMQTALGGADKISAIQDYEETVRAVAMDPGGRSMGEVRKRTRWMRNPNLLRLDQIGPRGTYVLFLKGSTGTGWEILPDMNNPDPFKTTGKSTELAGGELKFAKNYLAGFQLTMWLADRMPGYIVTTPAANVIRIAHDGDATDFTLDPATWQPVKTSGVSLANPDRPVSAEMRFEAWTEVAGVRFPAKRANYHNGVKMGEINDVVIHINTGLSALKLAATPPDFAPDIPPKR